MYYPVAINSCLGVNTTTILFKMAGIILKQLVISFDRGLVVDAAINLVPFVLETSKKMVNV